MTFRSLLVSLLVGAGSASIVLAVPPQVAKAPENAPAPPLPALATAAYAAAVVESKTGANPYERTGFVSWAELVTPAGETFVPVSLYVPKTSPAASAQNVVFFGVVEDHSGKPVAAFEDKVSLVPTKDDFFVDRSLRALPAGKYRGYFGIAAGDKPVALARADMHLSGALDKSAAASSPLILSNNVYALPAAQGPTDPFAFGGMKVVPKGDKVFRASADELWYFVELRNPGLAETIAPTEGTITGAPPEQKPKIQLQIDIAGKTAAGAPVRKSSPLADVPVMALRGVPGHFGVGSAFPLSSFRPGDYTIDIRVVDGVTRASYTLSDTFRIIE